MKPFSDICSKTNARRVKNLFGDTLTMRIASNLYDLLSTLCTLRSESLSAGHGGFLTESAPMHCIPILATGGALRDPGNFRQMYLFRLSRSLKIL